MLVGIGCLKKFITFLQFLAIMLMISGCLSQEYDSTDLFLKGLAIFLGLSLVLYILTLFERKYTPYSTLGMEFDSAAYKKLLANAKTNYTSRLVIDFYSKYEAAVRIFSKQQSEDEQQREIFVLFCMFLIRQMHNMGDQMGVDNATAKALLRINHSNMKTYNLGDYIFVADIDIQVLNLVEFRGKGKKGFDFLLDSNYGNQSDLSAILDLWGFGSLGHEILYYAVQSINTIIRYAMVKLTTDEVRYAYCDAVKLCGEKYLSGIITYGESQGQAAIDIYQTVFTNE